MSEHFREKKINRIDHFAFLLVFFQFYAYNSLALCSVSCVYFDKYLKYEAINSQNHALHLLSGNKYRNFLMKRLKTEEILRM